MNYEVVEHYDDGREKMVGIVVEVEGADGPTTEERKFWWYSDSRHKISDSGKRIPKTGPDYKAEIEAALDAEFTPKE